LGSRNIREVELGAGRNHRAGEPGGLLGVHAAQHGGHQQSRDLIIRPAPGSYALDEAVDLGPFETYAVALPADDLDGAHRKALEMRIGISQKSSESRSVCKRLRR